MMLNSLYSDTTVPMVYGSYTLEYITAIYHDHSVVEGQTAVFLVYTTGCVFDL